MTELHCIVAGRVQGVNYREFVRRIARELQLTGFVANLPDGSVEVLAQGDLNQLKVFMNHLRTGPENSTVQGIYDEWKEPSREFQGFEAI
jgi:acylphosphatase